MSSPDVVPEFPDDDSSGRARTLAVAVVENVLEWFDRPACASLAVFLSPHAFPAGRALGPVRDARLVFAAGALVPVLLTLAPGPSLGEGFGESPVSLTDGAPRGRRGPTASTYRSGTAVVLAVMPDPDRTTDHPSPSEELAIP